LQKIKQRNNSINIEVSKIKNIHETPPRHIINSSKNSSSNIITNISKDYSNNSIKINKNFKDSKKSFSKLISISSVQSPENRATYEIEDIIQSELKSPKKSIKEIIEDLENGADTSLKIKFMKDKFKDKYDKLINLLINCDNKTDVINDVQTIKDIVGDNYSFAQRFMKYVISFSKA
jgi:hypothetical protein